VQLNGTGNASLSNAFPLDATGSGGGPLGITGINPGVVDALNVGTSQIVTITGSGFTPTTVVEVNGVDLFGIPAPFTVVNGSTITFDPPNAPFLGAVTVKVKDGPTSASTLLTYQANPTPTLQAAPATSPSPSSRWPAWTSPAPPRPATCSSCWRRSATCPRWWPGLFSLDIGNNLASIFLIAQPVIGPTASRRSTSRRPFRLSRPSISKA
jgi:hypothetical protein